MKLTGFDALTFDCYGTLIDWESGIATALRAWPGDHALADRVHKLFLPVCP